MKITRFSFCLRCIQMSSAHREVHTAARFLGVPGTVPVYLFNTNDQRSQKRQLIENVIEDHNPWPTKCLSKLSPLLASNVRKKRTFVVECQRIVDCNLFGTMLMQGKVKRCNFILKTEASSRAEVYAIFAM